LRTLSFDFGNNLSTDIQLVLWQELVFGCQIRLNEPTINPLRQDSNPGCWLNIYNNNVWLVDFNMKNLTKFNSISLFEAIKIKYSLDSYDKVNNIVHNFITDNKIPVNGKSNRLDSDVKDRKTYLSYLVMKFDSKVAYTKSTLEYYKTYGISKENLYRDKVFCVSKYYFSKVINNQRENIVINPSPEVCVALALQNNRCKIYYPLREEKKWFSNTTLSNFWYIKGNDDLIICTSLKDAQVAHRLSNCSVFAPISETVHYTKEQTELIKSHSRMFSLGDGDRAGIEFNRKNKEIFGTTTLDILEYSDYTNQFKKRTKDISEIYRLDNKLCYDIISDGIQRD